MDIHVYYCKDGRMRAYYNDGNKHMFVSYPRLVMEQYLHRKLLHNEQIHHIDGNPLNNDINNLEIRMLGEHQREHSQKYFDKMMICPICKKEFLWTAKEQRTFHQNQHRKRYKNSAKQPFCSKRCSGIFGSKIKSIKGEK